MKIIDSETMECVSELSHQHCELLKQGYAKSHYSPAIKSLLQELREAKRFLECDCISASNNPPTMGIRKHKEQGFILANLPGRNDHSATCLLSYDKTKNKTIQTGQLYDPAINTSENGYLSINRSGIATLYRKLIHNSGLNKITPSNWKPADFARDLEDGARLSPELAKFGLAKKILYGYQSIQNAKETLKNSEHGEYLICINAISEFDNRSINLSLKKDANFWVDGGELIVNSSTSKGPFVAVTVMSKFKDYIVTIGSHIEPILSKRYPIPIKSNCHREVAYKFIRVDGVFNEPDYASKEYSLFIPMFPMKAPISEVDVMPDLVLQGRGGAALLGHPDKNLRQGFNELGHFVWFRELPFSPNKKQEKIDFIAGKVKEVI